MDIKLGPLSTWMPAAANLESALKTLGGWTKDLLAENRGEKMSSSTLRSQVPPF
jgi:hypothetical protein